jgi:hypothetical protein
MKTPIQLSNLFVSALLLTACASSGTWQANTGVRSSDPQLMGSRNANYDLLIVPGQRIGPVRMGDSVSDAIQHLGQPDRVNRSTFRGPGYNADEVYYWYTKECINFIWEDKGVEPRIESGWRGIGASCDKWHTVGGLQVGSLMRDVVSQLGEYCPKTQDDGTLLVASKDGILFFAKDRNSKVTRISVVPSSTSWNGLCKD